MPNLEVSFRHHLRIQEVLRVLCRRQTMQGHLFATSLDKCYSQSMYRALADNSLEKETAQQMEIRQILEASDTGLNFMLLL